MALSSQHRYGRYSPKVGHIIKEMLRNIVAEYFKNLYHLSMHLAKYHEVADGEDPRYLEV